MLVAIPTMGVLHARLAGLLLDWARAYSTERLSFFLTQKVHPHDRARNRIVQHFLTRTDASHLLMIDSDMVPPPDALERLLAHRAAFVTGLTPVPQADTATGITTIVDFCFAPGPTGDLVPVRRNAGLQEIHRCGAGCLMLHRSLFDRIEPPWFRFVLDDARLEMLASEDVDFCDRLRAAGVTLLADTEVICRHEKSVLL